MTDSFENASARGRARRVAGDDPDVASLRDRLGADDAGTRRDAALGTVDLADRAGLPDEVADALARRARADADAEVRQFAVEALGVAGRGEAAVAAVLDDPDEWVRAEAVVALSRVAGGDAADRLRDALDDDHGAVRRNALIALARLGEIGPDALVERLKEDPVPSVREYAADYLPAIEGETERAERLLAALLARDPDAFVRSKAAESLGELGTERAEEALEAQGLRDRSDDVRRTAKRALATARGVDPDALDVAVDAPPAAAPPAPGTGPDAPADRDVEGPAAGPGPAPGRETNAERGPGGGGVR
ncbi:MAG: HEAT repeat domain-containing protein [Haloferacaceae archaeon]